MHCKPQMYTCTHERIHISGKQHRYGQHWRAIPRLDQNNDSSLPTIYTVWFPGIHHHRIVIISTGVYELPMNSIIVL